MARRTFERLGADLALTRFVGTPSAVRLEAADSWGSVDLAVVAGGRYARGPIADLGDLDVVDGRAGLGQALIVRLLTPRGSLAEFGHPDYGSRLGELIGRLNDEPTRNLVRLYTIESLSAEPRIASIDSLVVEVAPGSPDSVRIGLSVTPLDDHEPLSLALEVAL